MKILIFILVSILLFLTFLIYLATDISFAIKFITEQLYSINV